MCAWSGLEWEHATYDSQMLVHRGNSLVGTGLQQLGCDDLLDCQNNTVLGADTDGGAAILHCLYCVLDLEVSTIGREDGVGEIVSRAY